jgi:Ca-activated chloride channel family protein
LFQDQDKGDKQDENKDGDNEKDKGKPEESKENEGDKPQQQQPVPGQLSPQQVKSLLEAMNNEEKKVQDKINAQKQKGAKVKSNKDW